VHASIHPSAGASCRRCRAIHANNQSSADPAVRGHAPHSDLVAIMGRSVASRCMRRRRSTPQRMVELAVSLSRPHARRTAHAPASRRRLAGGPRRRPALLALHCGDVFDLLIVRSFGRWGCVCGWVSLDRQAAGRHVQRQPAVCMRGIYRCLQCICCCACDLSVAGARAPRSIARGSEGGRGSLPARHCDCVCRDD
jgi:hypothetical protein